jgi:hypothetical protein
MRKSHALVLASAAVAVLGLGAFSAKSWEISTEIPESVRCAGRHGVLVSIESIYTGYREFQACVSSY